MESIPMTDIQESIEHIPDIPEAIEVKEITHYFIKIDSKGVVLGYSSSQTSESEIKVAKENLSEEFFNLPFFHRYNSESKVFVFDEDLRQKRIKEKESYKGPNEIFVDELVKTKMALITQQNINKKLLEESSKSKISAMQQQEVNKNLLKSIAELKINNMKGSN